MSKDYQNDETDSTLPAVPEQVTIVMGEIAVDVREDPLALAVGTGFAGYAVGV